MTERETLYSKSLVEEALNSAARDILRRSADLPALVGVRRGGVKLMNRVRAILEKLSGKTLNHGVVDINLYRDDWTLARSFPKVGPTEIPFSLEGKRVLLIDDVLYTGRTIRAALEALSEFGRSARVELFVLVDRGHREMPIKADYAPFVIGTDKDEIVEVRFDGDDAEVVLTRASKAVSPA
ncbi:MAG: bifunctional pyr operon transcriptional regulator/uracil phosphoribosyltransferase PyrR [Deltaproteobacteria bacterium]|jgi:pyrimidine operon attenuation protein/uracil phosphoribosyltransferase|nr:bifunctional pyr operon transcriptional regulator/uracil phosphoribosyltransferase PyrR [Deltaproteobacteria bacterium]